MVNFCTFCNTECCNSSNDGILVGTVSIETRNAKGKKKRMTSDGQHYFCDLSCLNTWLCLLAGDELND